MRLGFTRSKLKIGLPEPIIGVKGMLMVHGVFCISCFAAPMLGIFNAGWRALTGLEF